MEKAETRALLKGLSKLPELGQYNIDQKLGEGTFGVVVKAFHKTSKKTGCS